MDWLRKLASTVEQGPQLVNDSKTPSGRAHVGALRGVLIHDAAFRFLRQQGAEINYTFGCDDYDPLDELPAGHKQFFEPFLGRPLCNVPPPPGSTAADLADHYIGEFFGVFRELGVEAKTYRLRDIYRSGQFDAAIRTILENAHVVRRIYKEVSNSDRPEDWYPFQVVCEQCGRIGTTQVTKFDGSEVHYRCRHDLVAWSKGCGYVGSLSPFGGNGKLPWKLEWAAKWEVFGITIEGGGKDHSTKGGARDVAAACLETLFHKRPPANIPYEFFLVGGAKMSSSRGVGASAREVADLLPPEVLRFLMLKNPPARQTNFELTEEHLVKLFHEFDRLRERFVRKEADDAGQTLFQLSMVHETDPVPTFEPPFQLLTTLIQMPHLDARTEIIKRRGVPFDNAEELHFARRLRAAEYWLEHYASEDERLRIQATLPAEALSLTDTQKAYLHRLAIALVGAEWTDEVLQSIVFEVARRTPLNTARACEAVYRVFLDRSAGPRAGSLLACLEPAFVVERLTAVPFSTVRFWTETSESLEEFEISAHAGIDQIARTGLAFELLTVALDTLSIDGQSSCLGALGIVECGYSDAKGRYMAHRAIFSRIKTIGSNPQEEENRFKAYARQYAEELSQRFGVRLVFRTSSRVEDLRVSSLKEN